MALQIRIPARFSLEPINFTYFYAAYHGLAYYALMLCINGILPFSKGYIRILLNLFLLVPAVFIFLRNRNSSPHSWQLMPAIVGVYFLYFFWTGISFFWADSQGFILQGVDVKLNYFGLWLNYFSEFLIVFLLCRAAAIDKIAMAYLRGVRLGGVILAVTMLTFWCFGDKTGRLGFFDESSTVILPNWAAIKLSTSLLCALHLFVMNGKYTRTAVMKFLFIFMPMLIVLLLTIGKTAIAGFGLAFIAYVALSEAPRRAKVTFVLTFLLVAGLSTPLVSDYLEEYISNGSYLTLTDRTTLWGLILEQVGESPIIGHGVGSPLPTMWWNKAGFTGEGHNEYLNALFSTGVIGLGIVVSIFLSPLVAALRGRKHTLYGANFPFLFSVFILMFVFSLTASSPVGFFVPPEFLMVIILWNSSQWRKTEKRTLIQRVPPAVHSSPAPALVNQV